MGDWFLGLGGPLKLSLGRVGGYIWGHYGVFCDTLGPLGTMSGGPCAQFAGLNTETEIKT